MVPAVRPPSDIEPKKVSIEFDDIAQPNDFSSTPLARSLLSARFRWEACSIFKTHCWGLFWIGHTFGENVTVSVTRGPWRSRKRCGELVRGRPAWRRLAAAEEGLEQPLHRLRRNGVASVRNRDRQESLPMRAARPRGRSGEPCAARPCARSSASDADRSNVIANL